MRPRREALSPELETRTFRVGHYDAGSSASLALRPFEMTRRALRAQKVEFDLPVGGERSTPTDAIDRPTSVHGSAGPSNSASHWGYSTRDAPLRDPYRLAVNDCISGAADRHRPGKGDEHHTSGRNR